jgi:hypothetical protein
MLAKSIGFFILSISFGSVAFAQVAYSPMTAGERVRWLTRQNLAPLSLLEDVAAGAEQTESKSSIECGTHWQGFAKRVGIVTANYGVDTVMEAGLGSLWGEDPRYDRTEGESFANRLGHVVKMTFLARDRSGRLMPAYSRYLAIPGSSFLADTWMSDSETKPGDAALRAGLSFLSRMGGNAFKEFRPRR